MINNFCSVSSRRKSFAVLLGCFSSAVRNRGLLYRSLSPAYHAGSFGASGAGGASTSINPIARG